MPTKDGEVPKVPPVIVKVAKDTGNLPVNDSTLACLLTQGVE
jgi:hypothetical protein